MNSLNMKLMFVLTNQSNFVPTLCNTFYSPTLPNYQMLKWSFYHFIIIKMTVLLYNLSNSMTNFQEN